MEIRKFNVSEHLCIIHQWLEQHKSHKPGEDEIPAHGFIAFSDNTPVAAAFLRRVECGYGQIDGMVTNPEMSGESRHAALNAIVDQLLSMAKDFGMKGIMAITLDKSILLRSQKYEFVQQPHTLITLKIS